MVWFPREYQGIGVVDKIIYLKGLRIKKDHAMYIGLVLVFVCRFFCNHPPNSDSMIIFPRQDPYDLLTKPSKFQCHSLEGNHPNVRDH